MYKNKGSKKDCSNYRPISLLSIPSKVVEKFICNALVGHLESFNLFSNFQWGFRKQSSCEDLLLHMTEKWLKSIDSGKVVVVLFIDFQKAFDSVAHRILLNKLAGCGISGSFLEYIKSYFDNRSQYTIINGVSSDKANVRYGVPQGSILGPNCFSSYINDMPSKVNPNDGELDMFADDTTVFEEGDTVDLTMSKMIVTAKKVEDYSKRNSLTIHPGKCKILVISKKPFIGPLKAVKLNGKVVECVPNAECLGLTIDQHLNWEAHISELCQKFYAKIKKLYTMRAMAKTTLLTIYFQGILPSVLYAILIWGSSNRLQDLQNIHLKAARFIMRVKKSVPDYEVLKKAKWKPIEYYYKRSIASKAFKIFNNLSPKLLSSLISKSDKRKNRNSFKLELPKYNYVGFKKSFRYRATNVWNVLPIELRQKT